MPIDRNPTVFSFFAGSGLLDLAFEDEGFDIQYVNEYFEPFIDAYKFSRKKLGKEEPIFGHDTSSIEDVLLSGVDKLSQNIKLSQDNGGVVGFIGGPPCPDFSVGGKNKGKLGQNGKLSKTYVDLILAAEPDWFLFENVKGLWRTKRHREFFDEIMAKVGEKYHISSKLMNSLQAGVPQDRDRIFVFGTRKKTFEGNSIDWTSNLQFSVYESTTECDWPTQTEFKPDTATDCPNAVIRELTVQHWFEKNDVENHDNAKHHFVPRQALPKFKRIPEGDVGKKSFKRLHRWRYSPTVAYGNNEVHLHPYKARRLSVAEALSLQSMPISFVLPTEMSLTNMFKTIGNGVPYKLGRHVASEIKAALGSDSSEHGA